MERQLVPFVGGTVVVVTVTVKEMSGLVVMMRDDNDRRAGM